MASAAPARNQQNEGAVARTIEKQTAKIPSDTFLWAAGASLVASAGLQLMGNRHASVFVGQWSPTLLIFRPLQQACETARLRLHRSSQHELNSYETASPNEAVAHGTRRSVPWPRVPIRGRRGSGRIRRNDTMVVARKKRRTRRGR